MKKYLSMVIGLVGLFFATSGMATEVMGSVKMATHHYLSKAMVEWEPATIILFGGVLIVLASVCRRLLIQE
ncbi:MAG: hypothetical protein GXO58_02205 [Thermodesulfobacteria bacterium]|nr:hypothetical protein [Thermodesulfobacteriota bacterium]